MIISLNKTITDSRKAELVAKGYMVEDMGSVHGPQFDGMYRWMNDSKAQFQDYEPAFSADEAWVYADRDDSYPITKETDLNA